LLLDKFQILIQGSESFFSLLRVAPYPSEVGEKSLWLNLEEHLVPKPLNQRILEELLSLGNSVLLEN